MTATEASESSGPPGRAGVLCAVPSRPGITGTKALVFTWNPHCTATVTVTVPLPVAVAVPGPWYSLIG